MATAVTQCPLQVLSAKSRSKTLKIRSTSGLMSIYLVHTPSLVVPSAMATNAVLSACRLEQSTLQSPFTSRRTSTSSSHISQLHKSKPPVVVMVATRPPPPKAMVVIRLLLATATRLPLTRKLPLPPNTRHHPTLTRATSSHNTVAINSNSNSNSNNMEATSSRDRAQPRLLSMRSKAQGRDMVLLTAVTEEEQQPSSLL